MVASLLGKPVGSSQQTRVKKVTTFARICVEIDLSKPLLDSVDMYAGTYSWVQQLDYETLPFSCRLCHEYGHLQRRCPRYRPIEPQPSQPPRNPPRVDRGKAPIPGEGIDADGFTLVKDCILDVIQAPQDGGDSQMDTDRHVEDQGKMTIATKVKMDEGIGSHKVKKLGPEMAKSSKDSPHLGFLQKDIKKCMEEKSLKVGRKKDLDKIKLTGENLVESGSVKTQDSHFSSPLK
ncbi:uncharacterized protein LOC131859159 [Cryptomeria japonica]|uniref:uncharacterized protein LOC131859159 n=1 Tax=Cryptomeria japonica TaxID=3369 RepID=UPI0027DA4446|nr:uncharacterized protein LOC131859159 [Cryptomeria japonica]